MPPTPAKPTLGSRMRELRTRHGLTLKEMSVRVGLPFSTLAKVEHDRLTLTYDKLQAISERLNIRMSELFAETADDAVAVANGRRSIGTLASALPVSTPNYDYYYLSPELRQKDMIPVLGRLKARSIEAFGPMLRHDGQEFVYVLEGKVSVHTEFYAPVTLSPGESVYIDSSMGHAYIVEEGDQALVISVCSATQEELLDNAARQATATLRHPPPPPAVRRKEPTATARGRPAGRAAKA